MLRGSLMRRWRDGGRDMVVAVAAVGAIAGAAWLLTDGGGQVMCIDSEARSRVEELQRADLERTTRIIEAARAIRQDLRSIRDDYDPDPADDACDILPRPR